MCIRDRLKLPCPGITVLNKSSYGVIIVLILIIVLLVLIKTNSTILGSGNKQDNRGYIKYGMVDKMPAGEMENFGKLVFEDEDLEDQPAQVTEDQALKPKKKKEAEAPAKKAPRHEVEDADEDEIRDFNPRD
eukprot:TRINITY_DN0_c2535_g1_i1.p1 TRINITY_DN0_c2535_g1~~TRINITY_DN0_c2535_g1_i1.p1  ORF type:complete len:132 (-),score=43.02 TRINITY_DN0_c2535_g1_i1:20-415(-)